MSPGKTFRHVQYLWNETEAESLDPVERLVYRSNLLGSDQRITNTGGGNTSSKITGKDPLTGQPVEVLWVKGSGGDLRTATKDSFASLYQEKLLSLRQPYLAMEPRGPKTAAEDSRVGLYAQCTFNLNSRAPSIDTPLHSFIPFAHVDHMHPNAVIAIAASKNGKELTRKIYGDDVVWLPWQRPGFELGLKLQEVCKTHPKAKGAVLGQHGLINWAGDGMECYDLTLGLIERAAGYIEKMGKGNGTFGGRKFKSLETGRKREMLVRLLPWLRGRLSQNARVIGTVQDDEATMEFVNSADAPRLAELGTSCPDHFLRTKIKPLYVNWDPETGSNESLRSILEEGLATYRKDYEVYYNRCRHADSPAMRDPNPTVILIPGIGMVAWGKSKSESRVTAEFYTCAIDVMRGAEAIDEYVALPQQEAFDIEYWLLEEAKLKRMPAEKEMARRVVCVVGAGSGIGREVSMHLAKEGAHVACVDLNKGPAKETSDGILAAVGSGIGVAGTGISSCGPSVAIEADITSRDSLRNMFHEVLLAYGGLDAVAVTAGIFVPPDPGGMIPDEKWAATFAINVTGAYLAAQEAARIWNEQQLSASFVLTTSVNGIVPKKGSLAYDTSKAAANHLVRELALELAPLVRVNAVAPATVLEGSMMFPRERLIASLSKYKIPFSTTETDESLRTKLASFYAQRTLTGKAVTARDQSQAVFLLLSDRLAKTTGQILTVDGGLPEAFLR